MADCNWYNEPEEPEYDPEAWYTEADYRYDEAKDRKAENEPIPHAVYRREIDIEDQPCGSTKMLAYLMIALAVIGAGFVIYKSVWLIVPDHPAAWLGTLMFGALSIGSALNAWDGFRSYREWKAWAIIALCAGAGAARCIMTLGGI